MIEELLIPQTKIYPSFYSFFLEELNDFIEHGDFFGFKDLFDFTFRKKSDEISYNGEDFDIIKYEFFFKKNYDYKLIIKVFFPHNKKNKGNFCNFITISLNDDEYSHDRQIFIANEKCNNSEYLSNFLGEFRLCIFEVIYAYIKHNINKKELLTEIFLNIIHQLLEMYPNFSNYFNSCKAEININDYFIKSHEDDSLEGMMKKHLIMSPIKISSNDLKSILYP